MSQKYGYNEFRKSLKKLKTQKVGKLLEGVFWRLHKLEVRLDKEMRREVGKPLRKAEKLVKKAEKSNAKLANKDEKVRDPIIKKYKASKGCRA